MGRARSRRSWMFGAQRAPVEGTHDDGLLLPLPVVVVGRDALDAPQDVAVGLRDALELGLAVAAVEAVAVLPGAAHVVDRALLHDVAHLGQQQPVLVLDLRVAVLRHLLALHVATQLAEALRRLLVDGGARVRNAPVVQLQLVLLLRAGGRAGEVDKESGGEAGTEGEARRRESVSRGARERGRRAGSRRAAALAAGGTAAWRERESRFHAPRPRTKSGCPCAPRGRPSSPPRPAAREEPGGRKGSESGWMTGARTRG